MSKISIWPLSTEEKHVKIDNVLVFGLERNFSIIINVVKDMHSCKSLRTNGHITSRFSIQIRLHHRSTLSPCLFVFIMDVPTRLIQAKVF
jgi:hypothetical protein